MLQAVHPQQKEHMNGFDPVIIQRSLWASCSCGDARSLELSLSGSWAAIKSNVLMLLWCTHCSAETLSQVAEQAAQYTVQSPCGDDTCKNRSV